MRPSAVAVGGRSVWVYNDADPSVSEIDPATSHVSDTRRASTAVTQPTWMPSRGRCWPPTPPAPGSIGVDTRGRSYLTRVFSGPRGKREYRLDQRAPCSRGRLRRRLGGHPRNSRQRAAAHRPGHREGHQADALPHLLADRRSRRRPWQRLGRGLVHRNALPDQPSLGTRDGTDRPRTNAPPDPTVVLGLDLGRRVRLGR